jgi:serine O-acetyltransferase
MPSLRELIRSDVQRCADAAESFQGRRSGGLRALSMMLTPPMMTCIAHRLAHLGYRRGWRRLAWWLTYANMRIHKVFIDPAATIGEGMYIPHTVGVTFRGRAGRNLTLFAYATVGPSELIPYPGDTLEYCPQLGDNVTVGVHSTVLGPVRVGNRVTRVPCATLLESVGSDRLVVRSR